MGRDGGQGKKLVNGLVIGWADVQPGREGFDPGPSCHPANSLTVAISWLAVWPRVGTGVT